MVMSQCNGNYYFSMVSRKNCKLYNFMTWTGHEFNFVILVNFILFYRLACSTIHVLRKKRQYNDLNMQNKIAFKRLEI